MVVKWCFLTNHDPETENHYPLFRKHAESPGTNGLDTYLYNGLYHTLVDQITPQYLGTFISKVYNLISRILPLIHQKKYLRRN